MTIASCGSVSALTLGLPNSSAVPAEKATLPKGLFVARIPVSAKTKQRLANDIETITMLSLLRPSNTRLAVGTRIPEVLAIGLRLHAKNAAIPTDIVELIAMQRKSGIVFVCVRDADFEGTKRQECAFAVRRALPGRAGHTPTFKVFVSDWKPAGEAMLDIGDPAVDSIDALWESLCSQVMLGSASPTALDARMTRRMQAAQLAEQIDKLTRDHQRAKNPEQRNEIFTKLHKAKNQFTGCKLAVVDPTGKVLDTTVIYPTAPQNKVEEAKTVLKKLISNAHGQISTSLTSSAFMISSITKPPPTI